MTWIMKPGLPSGVSSDLASDSMEASEGGIVADLPRPLVSKADSKAHFLFTDVTRIRAMCALKVSQNVSSMGTPLISNETKISWLLQS